MVEFFRGWRQKAGSVTLAVATVLSAEWVRSLNDRDQLNVSNGYVFSSGGHKLQIGELTAID
jgi:hypothetical protein